MTRSVAKPQRPSPTAPERPAAGGPAGQSGSVSAWSSIWPAGVILLVTLVAYSNSIHGPFICDDVAITDNAAIRSLQSLGPILLPAVNHNAVDRRPVVNLSLAVNYAWGGTAVEGYHVFNLAAHVLAAWTLLAIIRQTLRLPKLSDSLGSVAGCVALIATAIWAVHPLLTNAVTYVIQRTEVLAGLFYLLTLYCLIRGHASAQARAWYVGAVVACLLALGSKESALSAPLVVMLYDRIFLAGSWREVWRRRGRFYLALASTWSLTAGLLLRHFYVIRQVPGGGVVSPNAWLDYALLQFRSLTWYLQLAFWPKNLIVDYGPDHVSSLLELVPYAALVLVLAGGTAVALRYRPAVGFLGVWFFFILAPSSGLIPLTPECAAEKRMYLPLAAVILAALAGILWLGRRWLEAPGAASWRRAILGRRLGYGLAAVVMVALSLVTYRRNEDYRTQLSLWQDTLAKRPGNARAHNNLGYALAQLGRFSEAAVYLQRAVELQPDYADAYYNHSVVLKSLGRHAESLACLRRAVEFQPDFAVAQYNLGNALAARGAADEAVSHYRQAVRARPDFAAAHYNLGNSLAARGETDEALFHYRETLRIKPDHVDAHVNLSHRLADLGRLDEAIEHLQTASRINPRDASIYVSLGNAFQEKGVPSQAVQQFQKALEIQPDHSEARYRLAVLSRERGRRFP